MFECPSRLKQWGATCLIQTRRNLRVTVYVETAAPLPFAHPHCSFFPHSRNNHTPPFLAYSQCKSPAGSFVYNTAGKRKCHLGTPPPLFFLRHSLSSSHVVHAVLVSLESDEQNFTLARASYYLLLGKKPTHRARCCHRPVPYTSHRVWPAHTLWGYDKRWVNIGARTCVFVCGKTKQERELGNPISHTEEQRQAGRYVPSLV